MATANLISSFTEPYPTPADLEGATQTHAQGNWQIRVRKLPISRAAAIDAMTERIGIPIPEMIFGDNEVSLRHLPTGWTIRFDAESALDAVDKTGEGRLQVAHAGDWARSRETGQAAGIRDVRPYDWSYSTVYRGVEEVAATTDAPEASTASRTSESSTASAASESSEARNKGPNGNAATAAAGARLLPSSIPELPLALLRRRDPILFHDDVILYESELDDNGISVLRVKLRVMPQRLLLLCRLYMRLDHVVVRVRDARVYVDLATDHVLREWTAREAAFDRVQRALAMTGLPPDAVIIAMRDANQVADRLPVVEHSMEALDLSAR